MNVSPENDGDGVDVAPNPEVHENVRHSTKGVEEPVVDEEHGPPATGLIGNGATVDPRYIAPR
ncbi:MAG: hypothetical protein QOE45_471 [Frankiaceae bacterium]|jgi:hypothetical protein|nr:hypothetical protein [Frankiaceae bacterium]